MSKWHEEKGDKFFDFADFYKVKSLKLSESCVVTSPRNLRLFALCDVFLAGVKRGRRYGVYPVPFPSIAWPDPQYGP